MSLSIESLRCFVESARLLNFRAAAKAVSLSPVAHGQRIRKLEEELGAKLFHRTTRSVLLTPAGNDLLPYAERVLSALEDCRKIGEGTLRKPSIELVLGTRHELGMSWILPMREQLQQAQTGLLIHLYFGSGPDLMPRIRNREIDCAVTSTRLVDPKLEGIRLHEEKYVFVGESKLLAKHPLKSQEDALQHTLFDTTDDLALFRYWRDAKGAIDSLNFRQVVHAGTIAAVYYLVMAGQGLGVLPVYYVREQLRQGLLTVVMPQVQPQSDYFRLVHRKDDPRSSLYRNLAETMTQFPLR